MLEHGTVYDDHGSTHIPGVNTTFVLLGMTRIMRVNLSNGGRPRIVKWGS